MGSQNDNNIIIEKHPFLMMVFVITLYDVCQSVLIITYFYNYFNLENGR